MFGIDEILYGKYIEISFLERIRDEVKFKNIDELKNQLNQDKEKCLKRINKYE
ncbi:MAG: hypothetical protein K6B64_04600 [Acholeplasmatales bacterium]|nr:hypothetical protein [Acholeplasmatales bacterium]